jgi:hypothetical protein
MNSPNLLELTMKVASELYEKNGREEGRDIENWVEAEKIVQTAMNLTNDNSKNDNSNNNNSDKEITKIASKLYDKSGQDEGRDFENWLEAERIFKAGKEFCEMFMQMLVQNPLGASKLMEAIKLLIELEQKQQLEKLIQPS